MLLLLLVLNLLWLRIGFELLQVLHQVPEVLSEVLQQVVLHWLVCLELVQQAGGAGTVIPVLLVDHHSSRYSGCPGPSPSQPQRSGSEQEKEMYICYLITQKQNSQNSLSKIEPGALEVNRICIK